MHPRSGSASKNLSSKNKIRGSFRIPDPWLWIFFHPGSRILALDFFPSRIPDPGVKKGIPNPQHCLWDAIAICLLSNTYSSALINCPYFHDMVVERTGCYQTGTQPVSAVGQARVLRIPGRHANCVQGARAPATSVILAEVGKMTTFDL